MTPPRPRAVVLASLALFAIIFVVLTIELSAGASTTRPRSTASRARPAPVEARAPQAEVDPGPEVETPEAELEVEAPEAELEVETVPPVVTSSS